MIAAIIIWGLYQTLLSQIIQDLVNWFDIEKKKEYLIDQGALLSLAIALGWWCRGDLMPPSLDYVLAALATIPIPYVQAIIGITLSFASLTDCMVLCTT